MIKAVPTESNQTVWGVSLGSQAWAAESVHGETGEKISEKVPDSSATSPTVLLPRLVGEPVRLDIWAPPHPRGSGEMWPLESIVDEKSGSGRLPLAAAWSARNFELFTVDSDASDSQFDWRWNFDNQTHSLNAMEGLANAMAQMCQWVGQKSPVTITIPNNFRQSEQQLVIDCCQDLEADVTLLWAPISGALAWLEQFEDTLDKTPEPKRNLLFVNLDWGAIAFTEMKLVTDQKASIRQWLPVRSRPKKEDVLPGFGWMVEAEVHGSLKTSVRWQRFLVPHKIDPVYFSRQPKDTTLLKRIQNWEAPSSTPNEVLYHFSQRLRKDAARYAGVIVTGDFADYSFERGLDLETLLKTVSPELVGTSIVAARVSGQQLLAKGAAIFATERKRGIVSYLDTLPELELFVETNGQYEWKNLLGDQGDFVPGGQVWRRPEPIRGLSVRRGASAVSLIVAHEEFSGVREVSASLSETAEQRLAAELHVSAVAAQGNATLKLNLFDEKMKISLGNIRADWRRMKPILDDYDQPIDKETFLKKQPRAYPELMPRKSSYSCWVRAREKVSEFQCATSTPQKLIQNRAFLSKLNSAVQQKDQMQYPNDATAIGSDGICPGSSRELINFLEGLLQLWQKNLGRASDGFNWVVRILGYLSVNNIDFEDWLIENLHSRIHDTPAIRHTFGLCARNPKNIASFLKFVFLTNSSPKTNDLKSVSQILRYRARATEEIESKFCEEMLTTCLTIFERDMRRRGRTFSFRWSSLIVVYLLRRRMFDPAFAEPEEALALRAKKLFTEAIQLSKSGRLSPIGGSVNVPAALQQMIDYIDKKGRGDILMAAEN